MMIENVVNRSVWEVTVRLSAELGERYQTEELLVLTESRSRAVQIAEKALAEKGITGYGEMRIELRENGVWTDAS